MSNKPFKFRFNINAQNCIGAKREIIKSFGE